MPKREFTCKRQLFVEEFKVEEKKPLEKKESLEIIETIKQVKL